MAKLIKLNIGGGVHIQYARRFKIIHKKVIVDNFFIDIVKKARILPHIRLFT